MHRCNTSLRSRLLACWKRIEKCFKQIWSFSSECKNKAYNQEKYIHNVDNHISCPAPCTFCEELGVVCRVGEHQHHWHISVHDENFHTYSSVKVIKHDGIQGWGIYDLNGWGIYGLNGWGIYDFKWVRHLQLRWVGQLWQTELLFFGRYAQKTLVFRGVPFLVLAWPRVSVPLNSWPVPYYRKGGITPHLSFVLWGAQLFGLDSYCYGHLQCYKYQLSCTLYILWRIRAPFVCLSINCTLCPIMGCVIRKLIFELCILKWWIKSKYKLYHTVLTNFLYCWV